MNRLSLLLIIIISLISTGCMYTKSMLSYAKEGTQRVTAGYEAKAKMTESVMKYIAEANKDCGVKITMVNGSPVTTVKECIRVQDIMVAVDRIEIVRPDPVKDVLNSAGDFIAKATPLAVPFASAYYNYQINKDNQNANVKITESNNKATQGMWEAYTKGYQNTTNTSTSNSNTSTSVTDTTNTTTTTTTDTSVTDTSVTDTITTP